MVIDNVQDQCVTGSLQTAVLSLPFPVTTSPPRVSPSKVSSGSYAQLCALHLNTRARYTLTRFTESYQ